MTPELEKTKSALKTETKQNIKKKEYFISKRENCAELPCNLNPAIWQ